MAEEKKPDYHCVDGLFIFLALAIGILGGFAWAIVRLVA
jgi:hypothetical protein